MNTRFGVKLCSCGANIAESMPACNKCQIKSLAERNACLESAIKSIREKLGSIAPKDIPDPEKEKRVEAAFIIADNCLR